jgi:hypothetical protein
VLDQGGDDVLARKDNPPPLAAEVADRVAPAQARGFADGRPESHTAVAKGHGRLALRRRWLITDPDVLTWLQGVHDWPGVQAIGRVQSARRVAETTTVGPRS